MSKIGERSKTDGTMALFESVAEGKLTPREAAERLEVIDAMRIAISKPSWGERAVMLAVYAMAGCFVVSAIALTVGLVRWAVGL